MESTGSRMAGRNFRSHKDKALKFFQDYDKKDETHVVILVKSQVTMGQVLQKVLDIK
jgi:hypothetical protein